MTLADYQDEWERDARIETSALDEAARNVPMLHAKWWRYYTDARLRWKNLDLKYKALYRQRYEYWSGRLDDAERIKLGWDVQPLKILSPQLPMYLEADNLLQEMARKRILIEETNRFLEDVIKSINGRGFVIKNMIDFIRFSQGA